MKTLKNLTTRSLLAGVGLAVAVGFSMNVQAQSCTIANWDDSTGSLFAGDPGDGNKRYGGPCSLEVTLNGAAAWVENEFQQGTDPGVPLNEPRHISRFYAFFGDISGSEQFVLYELYNTSDVSVMTLSFDPTTENIVVNPAGGGTETLSTVPNRWHSIEVDWNVESAGSESVTVEVGTEAGTSDQVIPITSTDSVGVARVGNVDGANTGGELYIDDFDSRRLSSPGRLCRGLTDPDRAPAGDGWQRINSDDRQAIFNEVATGGGFPAGGQPDFNEDGLVNSDDRQEIFFAIALGQNSCEDLR